MLNTDNNEKCIILDYNSKKDKTYSIKVEKTIEIIKQQKDYYTPTKYTQF